MKINCVNCGHTFEIDESYSDFCGQVRCWVCRSSMEVKTSDGLVASVRSWSPALSKADRKGRDPVA